MGLDIRLYIHWHLKGELFTDQYCTLRGQGTFASRTIASRGIFASWYICLLNFCLLRLLPPGTFASPEKRNYCPLGTFASGKFCLPVLLPPLRKGTIASRGLLPPGTFASRNFCLPELLPPQKKRNFCLPIPVLLPPGFFTSRYFCLPELLPPGTFLSRNFCLRYSPAGFAPEKVRTILNYPKIVKIS